MIDNYPPYKVFCGMSEEELSNDVSNFIVEARNSQHHVIYVPSGGVSAVKGDEDMILLYQAVTKQS